MSNNTRIGGKRRDPGGHYPAIIKPEQFSTLLCDLDRYEGRGPVVGACLRLLPLLAQRPQQVVEMEWSELDLEAGDWIVPSRKRKMPNQTAKRRGPDFIVPLPRQAVAILEELKELTGGRDYVFIGRARRDHITLQTLRAALRSMGYQTGGDEPGQRAQSLHGFRASFLSLAQEVFGEEKAAIADRHLAHTPKIKEAASQMQGVYNRAMLTDERRDLVQRWADWCDQIKSKPPTGADDSNVLRMPARAA